MMLDQIINMKRRKGCVKAEVDIYVFAWKRKKVSGRHGIGSCLKLVEFDALNQTQLC